MIEYRACCCKDCLANFLERARNICPRSSRMPTAPKLYRNLRNIKTRVRTPTDFHMPIILFDENYRHICIINRAEYIYQVSIISSWIIGCLAVRQCERCPHQVFITLQLRKPCTPIRRRRKRTVG